MLGRLWLVVWFVLLAPSAYGFSLDDAAPLFTGPASRAWREGRYQAAAEGFEAFLRGRPGSKAAAARLMAGLSRARAKQWCKAADHLLGLGPRLPTLGIYARYEAAKAALECGRPERALRELKKYPRGTPLSDDALLLRARILERLGRARAAYDTVVPLAESKAPGERALTLALRLAKKLGRRKAARRFARILWARYPGSRVPAPAKPTMQERLDRAGWYLARHRHGAVLKETKALVADTSPAGVRCQARFLRGLARYRARKYRAAVDELTSYVDQGCDEGAEGADRARRARALYYAARAAARSGKAYLALGLFDTLVAEHRESNLADDALLLKSEVLLDKGDPRGALAALRRLTGEFPKGDMYEEAWWRRAWIPYRRGRLREALGVLEQALAKGVRGQEYYSRGRLEYWRARILGKLRRIPQAVAGYRDVIRHEPLSYYAQLAAARLRATDPAHLEGLPLAPGRPKPWRFSHREEFDTKGFERGVALLSLGLGAWARREFETIGLLRGGDEEELWLAAVLFQEAGLYHRSHDIPRRKIPGFQDHFPDDGHVHQWRVAYPTPFARQVEAAAKAEGVPRYLLFGLMREESGFNPTIESYAHAIGLTQLLVKTARHVAKGLKLGKVTRARLMDPGLNLRLGARYLASLLRRTGHPALAVSGYNAGGAAAMRWRRRWPGLAPDELVEAIPYEQTRNYTKRVIEAYGRYRFLYGSGRDRYLRLPTRFAE